MVNSGHRGVQIHVRAWPPGVDSSQQQPLHAEHQGAKNSEHCLLFVNTKNIRLLRIVPFLRRLSTTLAGRSIKLHWTSLYSPLDWFTCSSTEDTLLLLDLMRQKKQEENERKKVRARATFTDVCEPVLKGDRYKRTFFCRKLESGRWLWHRNKRKKQHEGFRFSSSNKMFPYYPIYNSCR